MQAIPPATPIAVTLQAQEWNVVLGALGEAPYRLVAPVIAKISEQAEAAAEASTATVKPNGADEHAPH